MLLVLWQFFFIASTVVARRSSPVNVSLNKTSGIFQVLYNGEKLLESGPFGFVVEKQWYSPKGAFASGGELKFVKFQSETGKDVHGAYTETSVTWETAFGHWPLVTKIRVYNDVNAVVFTTSLPKGSSYCSFADDNEDLTTAYPTFKVLDTPQYNFLTYYKTFNTPQYGHWNPSVDYPGGYQGGGPLVLYDKDLKHTLVLSSLSNFMVSSIVKGSKVIPKDLVAFGLQGKVATIPENFEHQVVLHVSEDGVNDAFESWGDFMLLHFGKRRAKYEDDIFLRGLGYWTDNGAYYYYQPEKGKNYEETVIDISNYLKNVSIPIQTIQYDSWWYYRSSYDNGLDLWEPRPDIFPNGMEYLNKKIDLPVALHNRWFSQYNQYESKLGYQFYTGAKCSLPRDKNPKKRVKKHPQPKLEPSSTEDLYHYMMQKAVAWGLTLYEQDWLDKTYRSMQVIQNNTYVARNWLLSMNSAAAKLDLTIQLCMPYPEYILQTLEMGQTPTHARASNDYTIGRDQWAIGLSSLYLWAVGLVPFKDNFWSGPAPQPGCRYGKGCREWNPQLQAVVACLSGGPVGFSDKMGYEDRELVMETARADGVLLKVDRPAGSLDCVFQSGFGEEFVVLREIWGTYTCVAGGTCHFYVLGVDLKADFEFGVEMLPRVKGGQERVKKGSGSSFVAVRYEKGAEEVAEWKEFDSDHPIVLKRSPWHPLEDKIGWELWTFHEQVENCGFVVLGEMKKIVGISSIRIKEVQCDSSSGLKISLIGVKDEKVGFAVFVQKDKTIVYPKCVFGDSEQAQIVCNGDKTCSC